MLTNYLITSFRNLVKDRLYSIINILGLAIALTTCFFIYSWLTYETNYDTFDGNGSIYRVVTQWDDTPSEGYASTYPMIRTRVLSQFPEVEESVRLFNTGFLGSKTRVTYQTNINTNSVLYFADSTLFKIFPATFLEGFKEKALAQRIDSYPFACS
jgi:putative ABC transport system permease protein